MMTLTISNIDEFYDIAHNNYEISKAIIDCLLLNLKSKKHHFNFLKINVLETNSNYFLSLDTRNAFDILMKNLIIFEQNEDWEGCILIRDTLNSLK